MRVNIEYFKPKQLIGKCITTNLATPQTALLWQSFMREKAALPALSTNITYSVEIYPNDYFNNFNPLKSFEKWAAVEYPGGIPVPDGFALLQIPEGSYAVFHYRGHHLQAQKAFDYIFNEWLPASDYLLDHRPHFELMGPRYKNNSDESEELFYIPLKPKL